MCWLLDRLSEINWGADWVSAISSAIAVIISTVAILVTALGPKRERARSRTDSTHEVLLTTHSAVVLFGDAKASRFDNPACLADHAAMARMLLTTLEVLILRPELTDGAVVTASGSIALMKAIIEQHEDNMAPGPGGLARRVYNKLPRLDSIDRHTKIRAKRVVDYACKMRWPEWKEAFIDEKRIQELRDAGAALIAAQSDADLKY